jgi:hypothetical protein
MWVHFLFLHSIHISSFSRLSKLEAQPLTQPHNTAINCLNTFLLLWNNASPFGFKTRQKKNDIPLELNQVNIRGSSGLVDLPFEIVQLVASYSSPFSAELLCLSSRKMVILIGTRYYTILQEDAYERACFLQPSPSL